MSTASEHRPVCKDALPPHPLYERDRCLHARRTRIGLGRVPSGHVIPELDVDVAELYDALDQTALT